MRFFTWGCILFYFRNRRISIMCINPAIISTKLIPKTNCLKQTRKKKIIWARHFLFILIASIWFATLHLDGWNASQLYFSDFFAFLNDVFELAIAPVKGDQSIPLQITPCRVGDLKGRLSRFLKFEKTRENYLVGHWEKVLVTGRVKRECEILQEIRVVRKNLTLVDN